MLLPLVLSVCLQTLQVAPLPPPLGYNSTPSASDPGILTRDEQPVNSDCGGPDCRTVYVILQSCLLTIFACVWTSAHPNINGPLDSWWTCMKRKVLTMLCVVTAPELVLYWALRQRSAAKAIAKAYNKKLQAPEDAETDKRTGIFPCLKEKITSCFRPLPRDTSRRGRGQRWTITHGFFIQMGGFILYENEYPKEVLDYDRLAQLLQDGAIDAPTVTERELQDRSKGDFLSKAVIVLQTTWFVFQCIARAQQHLPLSELEVLTLAFAVFNAAIYAAWWSKPQAVDTAICVPLLTKAVDPTPTLTEKGPSHTLIENQPLLESTHPGATPPDPPQANEDADKQHSWLRRNGLELLFLPVTLPARILWSLFSSFGNLVASTKLKENVTALRVPTFYASDVNDSLWHFFITLPIVSAIFGGIHLLAWASEFPSHRDLVLWRISALILTVSPVLMPFFIGCGSVLVAFVFTMIPVYVTARFILIVIAFKAIHHPPTDVLRDIVWTSYIPHFSF